MVGHKICSIKLIVINIRMKKLILLSMIGIALSGNAKNPKYDWLVGDWSCDSFMFEYNKDLDQYVKDGDLVVSKKHLKLKDGKVYDEVFDNLDLSFQETKFETPYILSDNIEGMLWTVVQTGEKISDYRFMLVAESEVIDMKRNINLKTKTETICRKVK